MIERQRRGEWLSKDEKRIAAWYRLNGGNRAR
jgi:hypothetical protein